MKRILILFFICFPHLSFCQEFEMRNMDYETNPVLKILTEQEKNEPAIILEDKRITEYLYDSDNLLKQYYTRYRRVHINDQAMVESFNRIYLPVSNPDDLLVLKARSVSRNGTVIELTKADMKKVNEGGREFLILAIEGLTKDSEVEYFYTSKRSYDAFFSETLQSQIFVRHSEVKIICPQNLFYEVRAYNGNVAEKDTIINSKKYLSISCDSLPPLDDQEDYATDEANLLRLEFKLTKNTLRSSERLFTWDGAGERYYQMMHFQQKSARKDIKKLAKKIGMNNGTDEEKVLKLENFLKSQINIVPQQKDISIKGMIKNKYGSETTIVSLYVLMLEHLNIPAEMVITTNRFEKRFDPDFDTWNFLEKNLIYLPSLKKYIDPVNYGYRLGLPPYQFTANDALFIKGSQFSEVKKIEPAELEMSYDNMEANVSFSGNLEDVNIKLERKYKGYAESTIRTAYFYSNTEDRAVILKNLAESIIKDAKVSDEKISNVALNSSELNEPVKLDANLVSNSLIERAGENRLFSVGQIIGPQVEMYEAHERQNPIDVAFLHSYNRVINVKIPDGYKVKGLDKLNYNITMKDSSKAYMGFTSGYTIEDNTIKIKVNEFYDRLNLPVSEFENFKKVINAAADFNKIKLILVKS